MKNLTLQKTDISSLSYWIDQASINTIQVKTLWVLRDLPYDRVEITIGFELTENAISINFKDNYEKIAWYSFGLRDYHKISRSDASDIHKYRNVVPQTIDEYVYDANSIKTVILNLIPTNMLLTFLNRGV